MPDLVLLAVILLFLLWGWFAGGIRVVAGIGALFIAFQVARYYSVFLASSVTEMLPLNPESEQSGLLSFLAMFVDTDVLASRVVQVILFIVIFVVARWLVNKLASLLTSLFGGSIFGLVNRALGAVSAGVLAAVLLIVLHSFVLPAVAEFGLDFADTAQVFLEQSRFVMPLLYVLPQLVGR